MVSIVAMRLESAAPSGSSGAAMITCRVADRDAVVSKRREFLRSRLVALLHREPEIARPRTFERDG